VLAGIAKKPEGYLSWHHMYLPVLAPKYAEIRYYKAQNEACDDPVEIVEKQGNDDVHGVVVAKDGQKYFDHAPETCGYCKCNN
jgi:hypothetical protein